MKCENIKQSRNREIREHKKTLLELDSQWPFATCYKMYINNNNNIYRKFLIFSEITISLVLLYYNLEEFL